MNYSDNACDLTDRHYFHEYDDWLRAENVACWWQQQLTAELDIVHQK